MEKPNISFFIINIILLFVVTSFILIVFDLHRFAFVFELGILLSFIFFLTFGIFIVYHNKKWGWTLIGAILVLILLNTFFIFLITKTFDTAYITIIFFSVIGLVIALLNLRETGERLAESEIEEKAADYYPYIDKMEPEQTKEDLKIEKTFTPGKFVASKQANKFHIAKCDWAKRISKSNQVWFNSREEAEAQGFEADRCVQS